jgi:SAM-dependent methyltransferase
MKWIQLNPPGTWCTDAAFEQMAFSHGPVRDFIEVGPGQGRVSRMLCARGLTGIGIEYSPEAASHLRDQLHDLIQSKQYQLVEADLLQSDLDMQADLVFCQMVLEHIEDDRTFLRKMVEMVRPGGQLIVVVPARQEKWGIEDDISGHYRRYDRQGLAQLLSDSSLVNVRAWSLAFPVANWLLTVSNLLVGRKHGKRIESLSLEERTKLSGIRDVPGKTMFPACCKVFLNRWTMRPFTITQKFFFHTDRGLALIAGGIRPE